MLNFPKSTLHQAAIDAPRSERDLTAARVSAAQSKLRREIDAKLAIKEHEAEKIAIRAKTASLRAARLAREAEAEAQAKAKPSRVKMAKPRAKK
ncbi:hypothetical protein DLM45_08855 [Hyphomicrobium methylovorum]|nr:hypothetical protein [Hyphomicrobium methylovorum]